jgi:hypothetical protein
MTFEDGFTAAMDLYCIFSVRTLIFRHVAKASSISYSSGIVHLLFECFVDNEYVLYDIIEFDEQTQQSKEFVLLQLNDWFMFYFFCLNGLLCLAASVSVPYSALTPDLTTSYDMGTELTSFRMICCIVYSIIVSFVHSVLIRAFPQPTDPNLVDYAKGNK